MPVDDKGRIVCITHKDKPMVRQPSYYFLSQAEKDSKGGLKLLVADGMPLTTFVCQICGYVENYAAMASTEWNIKKLYVKCKNEKCKREFQAPIQMDEQALKTAALSNNRYQCYFCKESNTYDKEDHFFR